MQFWLLQVGLYSLAGLLPASALSHLIAQGLPTQVCRPLPTPPVYLAEHQTIGKRIKELGGPLAGLVAAKGQGDNIKTLPAGVVSTMNISTASMQLLLSCGLVYWHELLPSLPWPGLAADACTSCDLVVACCAAPPSSCP